LYLAAVVIIGTAAALLYGIIRNSSPANPDKTPPDYTPIKYLRFSAENPYSDSTVRENVMTYVMHPRLLYAEFGGETVAQKLFKGAWVEEYDHESGQVYFGLDKNKVNRDGLTDYIGEFITDPSRVEYATDDGKEVRLKDYTADSVKFYSAYLFRTPLANLKINLDQVLDFGRYQITMREMADFMSNKSVYGGNPEVRTLKGLQPGMLLMGNHGMFVARPNEPSLQRFIRSYLARYPGFQSFSREKRVQLLLNFVSEEIEFDDLEANSSKEWLKRPDETLISGRGDCSNKSILFASLLEQIDEDYLLVYVPEHITVAVRQGQFSRQNGLTFTWDATDWIIAETTASGFQIGESIVSGAERLKQIQYIQRPSRQITIYNYSTKQPLGR
jgi:hypothetical protein